MRWRDPLLGVCVEKSGFALKQAGCAIGLHLGDRSNFAIEPWSPLRLQANERKRASCCFPRSEIDLVVDLSEKDIPTADLLDFLVPAARANAP